MSKSFQSFVDYDDKPSSPPPDGMVCISRKLLSVEREGPSCDDVIFSFQFQEPLPGKITSTSFCLFFQPFIISSKYTRVPRRFTFLDEQFTVPLCSIETIFYTVLQTDLAPTPKELKELTAPLSNMEPVSYLKLFLKDFRIVTIDLTKTQHSVNFANQLLHFSRPSSVEHLVQAGANLDWMTRLEFNDEDSWIQELKRCCAGSQWRICNMRKELHNMASSYPMYVIVPNEISSHDLNQMVEHHTGGRFPIWVWSAPNGTALIRSSFSDDTWIVEDVLKRYRKAVIAATSTRDQVQDIKINDAQSTSGVRSAYKKLRKLCSMDSHELYNSREKDWFTRVHDTGWTQLVYFCLKTTAEILQWMIDRGFSVFLTESEGIDVSAVISSLVQLCSEQESRSISGMERIINKEWIALGHPFGQRICGVTKAPTSPTFLLFLDCVSQLKRLYPAQFGFSDHFLISLWDISLTGCVPAFACSSVFEQLATYKKGGPFPLSRFFTEDYRNLFSNSLNDAAQFLQRTRISRSPMRSSLTAQFEVTIPILCDVIRPPTLPLDVQVWDLCYLRWIPRANTLNAGEVISEMVLDDIMENLSQKAGLYWKRQHPSPRFPPNTLGPSYPYSLPQAKPYITYNLSEQMDSLSVNSAATFQMNISDKKNNKSRSNSLTIPEPAPRRPFRKAPPPPPRKNSDSVFKTHF